MRVLGKFGDPDVVLEGCFGHGRVGFGEQCGGLCFGIFEDPARGSDRGSQDQPRCMWSFWLGYLHSLTIAQEDELIERTKELLEDNADQVMQLMIQYAQSSRTYRVISLMVHC